MIPTCFGYITFRLFYIFRDMPHFVRRDILPVAKGILRPRRSGILFAHTTAAGNITRRSRISLRSNITRVRRIELKKHLRMQVFFLVGEDGFEPSELQPKVPYLKGLFKNVAIFVAIYISKSAMKYHIAIYLFHVPTSSKPA